MKITIYDFLKNPKEVEITKEVASAVLLKISGDQCLIVKYKDGEEEWFDSCEGYRLGDYFDDASFVELKDGSDFKNTQKTIEKCYRTGTKSQKID